MHAWTLLTCPENQQHLGLGPFCGFHNIASMIEQPHTQQQMQQMYIYCHLYKTVADLFCTFQLLALFLTNDSIIHAYCEPLGFTAACRASSC